MKRFSLLLLIVSYSLASYALRTTFTSSIYIDEDNNSTSSTSIDAIHTNIRRVRLINQTDSCPELETSLFAAECIFSHAMKTEMIELVPLEAIVTFGNASDFDHNEVCRVDVEYTDTILDHFIYRHFYPYSYSQVPVLIPMSIYNQCAGTSQGPCMTIYLNPNIQYNFDTIPAPNGMYDATTVLLRALAIGCGIQSSLEPSTVQFGRNIGGRTYISAFDTHIYNDLGHSYSDVALGEILATDFLDSRTIFAEGFSDIHGTESLPVNLFNDWEIGIVGTNVTKNTLNTINPVGREDSSFDILDVFVSPGVTQRKVTPYTMAILHGLGWIKDIPVGLDNYSYQFYNSTLSCENMVLTPDYDYDVELSQNTAFISEFTCELQGMDSTYSIGSFDFDFSTFSYHSIPEDIQWERNPFTKNIVGIMRCTAEAYMDGRFLEAEKTCNIEIPYKPNNPLIQKSESTIEVLSSLI